MIFDGPINPIARFLVKKLTVFRIVICLIQPLVIQPAFSASSVVETVGGVHITLPAPNGFTDPSSISKDLRSLGKAMTFPTNRLLALFVSEPDIARIASGKVAPIDRYFMVQTPRQLETTNVSVQDFVKFREIFKQQQRDALELLKSKVQQNLDNASKEIGRKYQDPSFAVNVGEMLPLGIFIDEETSVGMAALANYSVVIDGKVVKRPMVGATTLALIKNRIIFLYAYSVYKSHDDIEWVHSVSRQWVSSVAMFN